MAKQDLSNNDKTWREFYDHELGLLGNLVENGDLEAPDRYRLRALQRSMTYARNVADQNGALDSLVCDTIGRA